MGFINDGIEKAVKRQRNSIENEAIAAGCEITGIVDLPMNEWKSLSDQEFEKSFNNHQSVKPVTKRIEWSWKSGFTSIDFKWTVQIRPVDEKSMHLVMKAGRYGGFTSYKVGLDVFVLLCDAITKPMYTYQFRQASAFIEPVSFEHIFNNYKGNG